MSLRIAPIACRPFHCLANTLIAGLLVSSACGCLSIGGRTTQTVSSPELDARIGSLESRVGVLEQAVGGQPATSPSFAPLGSSSSAPKRSSSVPNNSTSSLPSNVKPDSAATFQPTVTGDIPNFAFYGAGGR